MKNIMKDNAVKTAVKLLKLDKYNFVYELCETPERQGLSVTKSGDIVKISFSERVFLFRALGLLSERAGDTELSISETARFTTNGIMLDCSRNAVLNIPTVKRIIHQLALMGHNTLMLYTEDTYEVEGHPYFGYMRGRYTVSELRELDDYAAGFGIEMVPCIQTLGHMHQVLKWRNTYGQITDSDGILLIGEEKTYHFIEEMIKACRKAFRSNRIHIGMDEAHFMGRGAYYDKHGDRKLPELFLEHLNAVNSICEKYNYRPMIWGDMPLRQAGCTGYTDCDIGVEDMEFEYKMPDSVDFVYWDYYSLTEERYDEFIRAHKKISDNVIFAGCAWRYLNFSPSTEHSLASSHCALKMCRKNGIKEVFVTFWGDDGNEQSYFSPWPVLQLFAEYSFYDTVDDEHLARRFKTCTGGIFEDFCTLSCLNYPGSVGKIKEEDVPRYLFYQDVLLGQYDYYVEDGYNEYYAGCAKRLRDCESRAGEYAYIFAAMIALCDVLSDKSEIGVRLKRAYDAGQKEEMKTIAQEVLPRIIANVERFRSSFQTQWMNEAKIFGFEIMDIRFGALERRLLSAKERITAYISGEILSIPELEEERLPYDSMGDKKAVLSANWKGIVSTSF